jgi:hypothetical protein
MAKVSSTIPPPQPTKFLQGLQTVEEFLGLEKISKTHGDEEGE